MFVAFNSITGEEVPPVDVVVQEAGVSREKAEQLLKVWYGDTFGAINSIKPIRIEFRRPIDVVEEAGRILDMMELCCIGPIIIQ